MAHGRLAILLAWLLIVPRIGLAQKNESAPAARPTYDQSRVGDSDPDRIVVPTNQVLSPLGRQVAYGGRPVDLALESRRPLAGGARSRTGAVDRSAVRQDRVARCRTRAAATRDWSSRPTASGCWPRASAARSACSRSQADGELEPAEPIKLAGQAGSDPEAHLAGRPGGRSGRQSRCGPCSTCAIRWPRSTWPSGKRQREIAVGNAPFGVVAAGRQGLRHQLGRAHARCQSSTTGPAGRGAPVRVDPVRHIASDGSVSVVDLKAGKEQKQIVVGLHPAAIVATPDGTHVLVANANSDTMSVIDTGKRRSRRNDFDAAGRKTALRQRAQRAGHQRRRQDAVRRQRHEQRRGRHRVRAAPRAGCSAVFPPAGIRRRWCSTQPRNALYVANVKGVGSRNLEWKASARSTARTSSAINSHDHLGTISLVPLPEPGRSGGAHRKSAGQQSADRNDQRAGAAAQGRRSRGACPSGTASRRCSSTCSTSSRRTAPTTRCSATSKQGEGDPELVHLRPRGHAQPAQAGRRVRAARQFLLQRRAQRRRPSMGDRGLRDRLPGKAALAAGRAAIPMAAATRWPMPRSGFLWDNVLAHKKTLRDLRRVRPGHDPLERSRAQGHAQASSIATDDFLDSTGRDRNSRRAPRSRRSSRTSARPRSAFPASCRDVYRADQFIRELKQFEAEGELPNLMIMLLPNDHTSGTRPGMPTPEAAVADNDLALGRIVEAVSHSKFWTETCIFVVEDDPQAGFDHIDGHRTVAMVISPYTPRARGRQHELQPDQHGPHDRADPRLAADESARRLGHADGQLLHGHAEPRALRRGPEQHSARSAESRVARRFAIRGSCTGPRCRWRCRWTKSTRPTKTRSIASCGTPSAAATTPTRPGPWPKRTTKRKKSAKRPRSASGPPAKPWIESWPKHAASAS